MMSHTIKDLTSDGRLVFALLCCERLYPNFVAFSQRFGWKDPAPLRRAMDFAWEYLLTKRGLETVPLLKKECDDLAPDTEDFQTILVSSALDAAVSVSLLLDSIVNPEDFEPVADIATLAKDTVDMYVQELEDMPPYDPNLEDRILSHPLMQAELKRQQEDLKLAATCFDYAGICEHFKGKGKSGIAVE